MPFIKHWDVSTKFEYKATLAGPVIDVLVRF